ncbi:MAG: TorF family putative porin, partial [Pseudolabrys sp.]
PVKAMKAPIAAPSPWDIAFGVALTSDYVLRGVSQSNHKPAVQGYFELQYTATDWLKLYTGVWGSSLWTGFANAEFDVTAGARFTFGNFGLDVGYIYYYYPGGVNFASVPPLANGSYPEVYVKPSYKFNDWLTVGGIFETGFGTFNNKTVFPGPWVGSADHTYYAVNAVITLPVPLPYGITVSLNPEIGREVYSSGVTTNMGFVSDTYWDVGLDFVYKAMTLDLRYWGTNAKPNAVAPNQCNTALGSGGSSNLCGDRFVATLKFDTSLAALK